MTTQNNQKPQNYLLELCFAAEQITESLQFCFYDEKHNRCEQLLHGPLASTFNFQKGDRITVKIMGSAQTKPSRPKGPLPRFDMQINNCSLVSIPELGTDDISMFDPESAITTLSDQWTQSEPVVDEENDSVSITATYEMPLNVVTKKGQWKISGYLSVNVMLNGKSMNKLYYFDPESSAGTGGWGPD